MFVSVIIPNLNAPTIDQTLLAIERQTYSDYEVLVVGMDIWGLVRANDKVRFIFSETPLPPARARNWGAKEARGDILVFTDADCIPRPDWLETFVKCFNHPEVAVVGGGVDISSSGNYWILADNLSMFYEYLAIHPAGQRRQLPSLNLAIRREIFEAIGGFDERYPKPSGEDADLTIRLHKCGYHLYFEPRAIVVHRPPRDTLFDLFWHGYYQGMYSTKVDKRYASEEGLPAILRERWVLRCFAPVISIGAIARMFITYPNLWVYWYTLPAIFLAKVAWCWGASSHP
ncbi:MAG: glycosyltransferase, partial [Candidatus Kryptoniota bacterium]